VPGRLFLLEVRHGVERRLLLDWLRQQSPSAGAPSEEVASLSNSGTLASRDLHALVDRLTGADDTVIIPLRVAWRVGNFSRERGLRLRDLVLGDPRAPGPLRARVILMHEPARATCVQGASTTLGELRRQFAAESADDEPDPVVAFASFVARRAALVLDSEERSVQGVRYRTPRFVDECIERRGGLGDDLERLARSEGREATELRREARRFLREMIARPSAFFLDLRHEIDRRLWLRGYDRDIRFDPAEFERLRATVRAHPTVLLFTHKAYGDAALPGYLMYVNDLPMLHTFGGNNLDLPGFGMLMRRSGGIFIRRAFRDQPLYALVLRHYVAFLLGERFPLSWALEGTRSRIGKLMPPKFGLLRYTLDAVRDAGLGELHIVPFVTSFELIRDVEEYVLEQRGRPKSPESLGWLLRYARGARGSLGRVRVDLGEDVVVREPPAPGDRLGVARVAFAAAAQANRVTPLTVTGVMCLLLLGMVPRGATAAELVTFTDFLASWARRRGIRLSDELAARDHAALFATLETLVRSGLLVRCDEGRDAIFTIDPARHPEASYYRNTVAHHFLDKALLELALARVLEDHGRDAEEGFWREAERLRELLKFEFFFPPREQFRCALAEELDRADREWRRELSGGTAGLQRLVRHLQPFLGHAVLLPYVEAYSVVIGLLAQLPPGESLDLGQCVTRALREGRRAYLLRRISSEASIGRLLFENGYRLAAQFDLTDAGAGEVLDRRQALLLELRALGRRMERLRVESLAHAEEIMARQFER
jgi:glycerol-3-phosphate O-acyltransferase